MSESVLPRSTVVVTTLYRHRDLQECLDAILAMDVVPDEILVVARGEDLQSQQIATAHGAKTATVSVPGLAAAIEAALGNVTTEIVAFVDDDARPHADWLQTIVQHFASDPSLGFVGGRDNVDGDGQSGSTALVVGRLRRGKLIGNHHLGKGAARPAMHAKGANMAYRTSSVRALPLGRLVRGSGAQHGNELFLGFSAIRNGYAGLYDPSVLVDHYPAPRQQRDGRLEFSAERLDADIRNSAGAIGLFVGRAAWFAFLARAVVVGDRLRPGIAWSVVHTVRRSGNPRAIAAVVRAVMRSGRDLRRLRQVLAAEVSESRPPASTPSI